MSVKRLEALADALAKMYGALDPESDSYQLRNPGMLKAFNPKHARNEKGYRIFSSFVAGYDNLILDLKIKISGKSRSHLTVDSTVLDLIHIYGQSTSSLRYIINFLRHALKDTNIPNDVKLGWFIEDDERLTERIKGTTNA